MRGVKSRQPGPSDDGTLEDSPGGMTYAPLDLQRGAFLRRCRARLKPTDVGLPTPRRSHGSGLRREDVAVLADVSMCWYTWLEQGRKMRVSDEVLERIAAALRLTAAPARLTSKSVPRPPAARRRVASSVARCIASTCRVAASV